MDPKHKMIAELTAAGFSTVQIAQRMGAEEMWVADVMRRPDVVQAVKEAAGVDDGTELYSGDQIKFYIEKLFPEALKVVEAALTKPSEVNQVRWKACEWVLSKATAVQELTKEQEGAKVINQFILNDRAAGALEKLAGEWGEKDWMKTLEASLREVPDGVE